MSTATAVATVALLEYNTFSPAAEATGENINAAGVSLVLLLIDRATIASRNATHVAPPTLYTSARSDCTDCIDVGVAGAGVLAPRLAVRAMVVVVVVLPLLSRVGKS